MEVGVAAVTGQVANTGVRRVNFGEAIWSRLRRESEGVVAQRNSFLFSLVIVNGNLTLISRSKN
jgi:hypothetical protein